jgi:Fe-Mn family superoxide dismutase
MKIFDILQEGKEPNISMPKLKFPYDGLEPTMSRDTIKFHYDGHTKKYFDTVNEMIKGTSLEKVKSLDELIAKGSKLEPKLYNSARQAKNHTFYWDCLAPVKQSGKPSSELMVEINSAFGSFAKFKKEFSEEGVNGFGSTWTWLVWKNGKLVIETTQDADEPTATPILVVDFWEHAWYTNYPADKKKYAKNIWNVINWDFVSQNLK